MDKTRYQRGIEKLMEYTVTDHQEASTHLKIEENLRDIAPDVSRFMIEFTYGDIYTRPQLDNKQRSLVTIASLVTQGTLPQLELHLNAGLTAGLTPEEIMETFIQLLSYTGFPSVLNSIEIAKKVFNQRGISVKILEQEHTDNNRYEKGIEKLKEYTVTDNKEASTHLKIEENLRDIAPDVSRFMIEFTYGDVYTRAGLDNKQRTLVTIASLVTQGTLPQLELHINTGLTAGVTPEEIIETFIQLLSYTGFPRVLNSIEVAKKVFADRGVSVK